MHDCPTKGASGIPYLFSMKDTGIKHGVHVIRFLKENKKDPAKYKWPFLVFIFLLLFNCGTGFSIEIGDPLPRFEVDEWIQGEDSHSETLNRDQHAFHAVITLNPLIANYPVILDELTKITEKYSNTDVTLTGFFTQKPSSASGEAVKNWKMSIFTDKDQITQGFFFDKQEDYPFYVFLFDRQNELLWKGYSLDMFEEFLQLAKARTDLRDYLRQVSEAVSDFETSLIRWNRTNDFSEVAEGLPKLFIFSERKNRIDAAIVILALLLDENIHDIPIWLHRWEVDQSNIFEKYGASIARDSIYSSKIFSYQDNMKNSSFVENISLLRFHSLHSSAKLFSFGFCSDDNKNEGMRILTEIKDYLPEIFGMLINTNGCLGYNDVSSIIPNLLMRKWPKLKLNDDLKKRREQI